MARWRLEDWVVPHAPTDKLGGTNGEQDRPCNPGLLCDLHGNKFRFCPLSMMLAVNLSYMVFIMLRCVPFNPTLLRLCIINGYSVSSNALSASRDMIVCFLSVIFFMWCIMFIDLQMLYQTCIPKINPT